MKSRSCLVQMIIFVVILAVVGGLARRYLGQMSASRPAPRASVDSLRQLVQRPLLDTLSGGIGLDKATPTLPAMPEPEAESIDGLELELSRPLMFPISEPRGLAVTEAFFYVSAYDPVHETGMLYQIRRDKYTIAQTRAIREGDHGQAGGLHMGAELLWLPLKGDAAVLTTLILGLDPIYLETRTRFIVQQRIVAVAEGPDGHLYGVDENSATAYAWNQAGAEVRRALLGTGARYGDLEAARGVLLCAGVNESGTSVLDVIDPATLSLLTRHGSDAGSPQEEPLAGRGFALLGEDFFFMPSGGEFPKIQAYVLLDGRDLADFAPSVAP